jgi:myo-inositol-1(or 4)-monophosphatase
MRHTHSENELQEIYTFALELSRKAGAILLDGVEKRTGTESGRDDGAMLEKMNAVDIVTQTDLGLSLFLSHFPSLIDRSKKLIM